MAQGEFWVERQNWARWPKVIKVNRVTESGTEMRRYVRKPSDFGESHEYALQKIAELKAENAKLRELVRDMYACISHANEQDWFYFESDKFGCGMRCTVNGEACGLCALADRLRELGIEVDR